MSRIGNLPINIPSGVTVSIADNVVTVKGAKGELSETIDPAISVKVEDDKVVVARSSEIKDHKAKHGLYRSLISNMIEGVTVGYKKVMELIGVGFRASIQGQNLELALGYSHAIMFVLPKEVKCTAVSERGKAPIVTFESHDKQLIGAIAAKLRSLRKPEPYKGKGIRFQGEQIRRKAGKTAAK
ncbi:MAG: 50S ribosomal protein L6 [Salibacteraceae bacterium]